MIQTIKPVQMKKTSTLIIIALLGMAVAFSCKSPKKEAGCNDENSQVAKPDSLLGLWINAWNTKNTEALKNMIAEKALVMDKEWKVSGRDSIMAKWININSPVISNLNCDRVASTICCCCVSATGFYKLDVTTKEGVHKETGNFTFIWKKQDDKSWKLELMSLCEFDDNK